MESDTLCCLLALSEVKNYLIFLPQERGWGGGGDQEPLGQQTEPQWLLGN